jgi:hypothetical protein
MLYLVVFILGIVLGLFVGIKYGKNVKVQL